MTCRFGPGSVHLMPNLNIRTQTTHHVDCWDLEQFIKDRYGINYEIVAAEEASNDSTLHFSVDGNLQGYELDDVRKLISGNWIPFRTRQLLNLMCFNEEIPTGEYYIEISW